jgi:hypothetical protein
MVGSTPVPGVPATSPSVAAAASLLWVCSATPDAAPAVVLLSRLLPRCRRKALPGSLAATAAFAAAAAEAPCSHGLVGSADDAPPPQALQEGVRTIALAPAAAAAVA